MARHDDPGLRMLERDLRTLAEPRNGDKQFESALRKQLVARPQAPRRRLTVRVAFGSTAVAAAAATAVIAILAFATGGSGGPSTADAAIIRHALIAVTPPANEILHVKVVGVQNGVPIAGETWQETSAPYANRGIKGDFLKENARRLLRAAQVFVDRGVVLWTFSEK